MNDKVEKLKDLIKNTGDSLVNGDVKPWDMINPQEQKGFRRRGQQKI